jgi:2-C-methyl-D-erythritol 4-phosphate cytidylyltransferase
VHDCDMKLAIVVAAAGQGTRLDARLPKQHMPVLGIPMLQRTLAALDSCARVDALVVVVGPDGVDYCETEIENERIRKVIAVTPGGEERPLSVRNGLRALSEAGTWDLVGVHDGARPLVTCAEIGRAMDALTADETLDGVVLGIPSVDTIKMVNDKGLITGTPDRRRVWRAQTPQIFRWTTLMEAYAQPDGVLLGSTDDASLVEALGGRVAVVEGSPENLKITDRSDLRQAEQILAERRQ